MIANAKAMASDCFVLKSLDHHREKMHPADVSTMNAGQGCTAGNVSTASSAMAACLRLLRCTCILHLLSV